MATSAIRVADSGHLCGVVVRIHPEVSGLTSFRDGWQLNKVLLHNECLEVGVNQQITGVNGHKSRCNYKNKIKKENMTNYNV